MSATHGPSTACVLSSHGIDAWGRSKLASCKKGSRGRPRQVWSSTSLRELTGTFVTYLPRDSATILSGGGLSQHGKQIHQISVSPGSRDVVCRSIGCSNRKQHDYRRRPGSG